MSNLQQSNIIEVGYANDGGLIIGGQSSKMLDGAGSPLLLHQQASSSKMRH